MSYTDIIKNCIHTQLNKYKKKQLNHYSFGSTTHTVGHIKDYRPNTVIKHCKNGSPRYGNGSPRYGNGIR